jgi:aflatoxin B1 aldehyde reductase
MSPRINFGAGCIGHTDKSFTFTWGTPEAVNTLLAKLKSLDVLELDSAASYPPTNPWNTETLLGQSEAAAKGFIIDTKVLQLGRLDDQNMTFSIDKSLRLLGTDCVRILYAHKPDPDTPLEETTAAFQEQFMAGKFKKVRCLESQGPVFLLFTLKRLLKFFMCS